MHKNIHLSPILPPSRVHARFAPDGRSSRFFYRDVQTDTLHTGVLCLNWFIHSVFNKFIFSDQREEQSGESSSNEERWLFHSSGRNYQAPVQTEIASRIGSAATEWGSLNVRGQLMTGSQANTSEGATSPQPGHGHQLNLLQCEIKWIHSHHC